MNVHTRLILGMLLVPILATGAGSGVWLDVPYVHQEKEGCGSAALAMVLQYWNQKGAVLSPERIDAEKIQRDLHSKEARGIRASAMERDLRESGFSPFIFRGEWSELTAHLEKGPPPRDTLSPVG